jgi:hypothetical protein
VATLTILIGNSDDKLKQSEWSEYIHAVQIIVADLQYQIHFHGFSHPEAPWQNACWVVEANDGFGVLANRLQMVAWAYHQDSIAVVEGETTFVKAKDRHG